MSLRVLLESPISWLQLVSPRAMRLRLEEVGEVRRRLEGVVISCGRRLAVASEKVLEAQIEEKKLEAQSELRQACQVFELAVQQLERAMAAEVAFLATEALENDDVAEDDAVALEAMEDTQSYS